MRSDTPRSRSTATDAQRRRDRAVSEVLGYTLIFTLIVGSIAIVTVGGLGSLENARNNEQVANAERAYDVLHDNLQDVHAEGAPSRATEISLGDSQIYFGDNVTMRVKVDGRSAFAYDDIRPLIFRLGDERQLVYEAGATLQNNERGGGIVLNDPPLRLTTEQAYLPIVRTTAPSVQSIGSTNVLVRGQADDREVLFRDVQDHGLEWIEIESPRYEVWGNYFEAQEYCGSVTVDDAAERARCSIDSSYDDPRQLYVTHTEIVLELID